MNQQHCSTHKSLGSLTQLYVIYMQKQPSAQVKLGTILAIAPMARLQNKQKKVQIIHPQLFFKHKPSLQQDSTCVKSTHLESTLVSKTYWPSKSEPAQLFQKQ